MSKLLTNRHDILFVFDVTNGNPNGDPDMGNQPRMDINTGRGFITDGCMKRKVRNFVDMCQPDRQSPDDNGFNTLIKQGAVIETEQKKAEAAADAAVERGELPKDNQAKAEYAAKWLCREFYDIRAFGGVLSTGGGVMKGSAFGQIRGPVQFGFGQSIDPINPCEVSITRCVVTKEEDKSKERTMGTKYIVPYGLYTARIHVSPAFAKTTGFTDEDLNLLLKSLEWMFSIDAASGRADMAVRGIYDFEHIGTHPDATDEWQKKQNLIETKLGCAPAHKLLEGIKISLKPGVSIPSSFEDYNVVNTWNETNLPEGVVLHVRCI